MKKLIGLFLLFFLMQVHAVQAADWIIKVVSDKDVYEPGEEAVFDIEITRNGKLVKGKGFIILAFFPDPVTAVSLVQVDDGKYHLEVLLDRLLENQMLDIKAIRKGKKEILLAEGSKMVTVMTLYESSFNIKEGSHISNNEITLEIDSVSFYEIAISEDLMFTNCQWQAYAPMIPFCLSNFVYQMETEKKQYM